MDQIHRIGNLSNEMLLSQQQNAHILPFYGSITII